MNKEELIRKFEFIAENEFKRDDLPEKGDSLVGDLTYFYDFKSIGNSPQLIPILNSIIIDKESIVDIKKLLSELNQDFIGLRIFKEILNSKMEDILEKACSRFFITQEEYNIISAVNENYKEIKKHVDLNEVIYVERESPESFNYIKDEFIIEYFSYLIDNNQWKSTKYNFDDDFFPLDRIDESKTDLIEPNKIFEIFLDESHYKKLRKDAAKSGETLKEIIAIAFQNMSRLLKGSNYIQKSQAIILKDIILIDKLQATELAKLSPVLRNVFLNIKGVLHLIASFIDKENTKSHLNLSHDILWSINEALPRLMSVNILFIIYQLEDAFEKIQIQEKAYKKVNELLADCTMIEEPLNRFLMMSLSTLNLSLWKADTGDFNGAIEHTLRAKVFAEKGVVLAEEQKESLIKEFEEEYNIEELDAKEKEKVENFRRFILVGYKSFKSIINLINLQYYTYKAKYFETMGNFIDASKFYKDASVEQENFLKFLKELTSDVFKFLKNTGINDQEFLNNEAKANYFKGLSFQSLADDKLLKQEFDKAASEYQKAINELDQALNIWISLEKDKKGNKEYLNWITKTRIKKRFIFLKSQQASAEKNIYLENIGDASSIFFETHLSYRELLNEELPNLTKRDILLLKGAMYYCLARAQTDNDSYDSTIEALISASHYYKDANEIKWGLLINTIKNEYEAKKLLKLSKSSQNSFEKKTLIELTKQKLFESISICEQNGFEERANELKLIVSKTDNLDSLRQIIIVTPQPSDFDYKKAEFEKMTGGIDVDKLEFINQTDYTMEDNIKKLLAKSKAITEYLEEAKTKAGIEITEEFYQVQYIKLKTRKNEIIYTLQEIVKGKDSDFDEIIDSAIEEDDPTIMQEKLIKYGEKKGIKRTILNAIKKNKDKLVEMIVRVGLIVAENQLK